MTAAIYTATGGGCRTYYNYPRGPAAPDLNTAPLKIEDRIASMRSVAPAMRHCTLIATPNGYVGADQITPDVLQRLWQEDAEKDLRLDTA